ncbi:cohesin domain-containing protein [Chitinimonas sp. BJYL2]|uniref:cohesin domain-containing protein n=1 Tax=Chitinimonas sp. BJYL2 TaxID=2976696 RepID=UPI0022B5696C|nr:cohesin domain-containing protein [Chitinimonas sp. BJYL2]
MHFSDFPRLTVRATLLSVALALSGCASVYHHGTGMDEMARGNYAEAVPHLQKAAELSPQDVRYKTDWLQNRDKAVSRLLAQADANLHSGKETEAQQQYQSILSFDPDNERARSGLDKLARLRQANEDAAQARDALKRNDPTLALKLASRALEAVPDQLEAKAVRREIEALQSKELLTTPSLSNLYKKPINLEFRDASVKTVFEALSRTTGINFIFDREVKADQRTTVFLRQTALEDAIDVILTTNQLDKKILNDTSVLIYPNTPAKAKEYQELVVRAFYLATAEAKQTAQLLKTVLRIKDVFVDDKLNLLVLREPPETIVLAEKLVALHDLDEPEVMLEVEVLEINRSRLLDLGIKLTDQFTVAPLTSSTSSGTGGSTTSTLPTFKLSDLKNLNSDKLGVTLPTATLSLRKEDGDANLLANPRIRVKDREKAKILIGDKVPVVTTTTTPNGFLSENIQYLDVGLKLEVEPDVHLRDEIGLKVSLEVSSVVNTVKTSSGSQAYQIGTRNASSVLRLKDGETQVLAGLISDEDRSAANRIPLLGDLPLLGRLFSSQKDDRRKTEIVLSITPRLIRNADRKEPAAEAFWSGSESILRTKPLQLRTLSNPNTSAAAPTTQPASNPAAPANPSAASNASPTPASAPAQAAAQAGTDNALPPQAAEMLANTSPLRLRWDGPNRSKVGEALTLNLALDSSELLRAAPLQLAYNPAQFEVVSVKEGTYFSKDGKGNFSQIVDKQSGRISVGLSSSEATGVKGDGRLMTVELKALAPAEAEISLLRISPVGSSQAIVRPVTPIVHKVSVAP